MISSHARCDWCERTLAADPGYEADDCLILGEEWLVVLRGWNDEDDAPEELLHFDTPECLARWAATERFGVDELFRALERGA